MNTFCLHFYWRGTNGKPHARRGRALPARQTKAPHSDTAASANAGPRTAAQGPPARQLRLPKARRAWPQTANGIGAHRMHHGAQHQVEQKIYKKNIRRVAQAPPQKPIVLPRGRGGLHRRHGRKTRRAILRHGLFSTTSSRKPAATAAKVWLPKALPAPPTGRAWLPGWAASSEVAINTAISVPRVITFEPYRFAAWRKTRTAAQAPAPRPAKSQSARRPPTAHAQPSGMAVLKIQSAGRLRTKTAAS